MTGPGMDPGLGLAAGMPFADPDPDLCDTQTHDPDGLPVPVLFPMHVLWSPQVYR